MKFDLPSLNSYLESPYQYSLVLEDETLKAQQNGSRLDATTLRIQPKLSCFITDHKINSVALDRIKEVARDHSSPNRSISQKVIEQLHNTQIEISGYLETDLEPFSHDPSFVELKETLHNWCDEVIGIPSSNPFNSEASEYVYRAQTLSSFLHVFMNTKSSLNLENSKISSLPDCFAFFPQLEELNVAGNMLSLLPTSIGSLKALKTLNLAKNKLSSLPDSMQTMKSLQKLNLGSNALSFLPDFLDRFKSLQRFNLANNNLSSLPLSLARLPRDCRVSVYNNPITEDTATQFQLVISDVQDENPDLGPLMSFSTYDGDTIETGYSAFRRVY